MLELFAKFILYASGLIVKWHVKSVNSLSAQSTQQLKLFNKISNFLRELKCSDNENNSPPIGLLETEYLHPGFFQGSKGIPVNALS